MIPFYTYILISSEYNYSSLVTNGGCETRFTLDRTVPDYFVFYGPQINRVITRVFMVFRRFETISI